MAKLDLPRDLTKGEQTLTANVAADYWNLKARGFVEVELTPQQKAARTRAANKAGDQEGSEKTSNVPDSATDPAGNANE